MNDENLVAVLGQQIRLDIRWGTGIPLVLCNGNDPNIPLANAEILNRLLPNAELHIHDGGHVELITNATEHARVIEEFRRRV